MMTLEDVLSFVFGYWLSGEDNGYESELVISVNWVMWIV